MTEILRTQCCVTGGGPAGMMLGFLLARAGVDVVVLEKHADFLRDFRGDTIHPSTLQVMHELGILEEFLKRPHQEVRQLDGWIGPEIVTLADFSHLPTRCQFIVFMPQWHFLNFIAEQAAGYRTFRLMVKAEVTDIIEENGLIAGVRATTPSGALEVRAGLTVGADGRRSVVRERAGLHVRNIGAPMDVMWMRVSRKLSDPRQTLGRMDAGRMIALLDRDDYWQVAYVIPKGTAEEIQKNGIAAFHEDLAGHVPFLADRVDELRDWDDVKLLTVAVDRLEKWWRPGLLCIGDAAHAMSPVGGVGINLAIQDAVAAANILGPKLVLGTCINADLAAVQQRRMFPMRATQKMQVLVQNNVITRVLKRDKPMTVPWIVHMMQRFPTLQRIPARVIGTGFRPEHVRLKRGAAKQKKVLNAA